MARKRLTKKPAVSSSPYEEEEEQPQNDTVETQQQQKSAGYEEEDDGLSSKSSKMARKRLTKKEKHGLSSKSSKPLDSHGDSADTESNQPPSPSPSDFITKSISPQRKRRRELELLKKKDAEDRKPKRGTRSGTGGSQRIWSDEDGIAILKGIIAYHKGKKNPLVSTVDLFEFVKESLQFNASRKQFGGKISKLKKKYYTDVENNENGKDEIFSKPHDLECVELASKIWGAGGIDVGSKSSAGKKRSEKSVTGIDVGSKSSAGKKRSEKSVTHGGGSREIDGGGSREIVLALTKVSMKKGKKRGYEIVNQEEKENLKRQKRSLNEEADGGDEDFSGEGKGNEGKKKKKKMILSEEVGEKGNEHDGENEKAKVVLNEEAHELKGKGGRGGEKQKMVVNAEINGEPEENEDLWEKYPHLRSSLQAENLTEEVKATAMEMLGKYPKDELVELETDWMSLKNAKLELLTLKMVLIGKQIKLALGI